jgi:hypothetical protein
MQHALLACRARLVGYDTGSEQRQFESERRTTLLWPRRNQVHSDQHPVCAARSNVDQQFSYTHRRLSFKVHSSDTLQQFGECLVLPHSQAGNIDNTQT